MSNIYFIEWLKRELEKRSWNNAKLAHESGISDAQITRLKSGEQGPSVETCEKLAKAFGYSPEVAFYAAIGYPEKSKDFDQETSQLIYYFGQLQGIDKEEVIQIAELKARRQNAISKAVQARLDSIPKEKLGEFFKIFDEWIEGIEQKKEN